MFNAVSGHGLGGVVVFPGGGGAIFADLALIVNPSFPILRSSSCGRANTGAKRRLRKRRVTLLNYMIVKITFELSCHVLLLED